MMLTALVKRFARTTEIFIIRTLAFFLERNHDVKLYHLLPLHHCAKLHVVALLLANRVRTVPFFSARVLAEFSPTLRNDSPAFRGIRKAIFRRAGEILSFFSNLFRSSHNLLLLQGSYRTVVPITCTTNSPVIRQPAHG